LLSANAFLGTVVADYCWARSVVLLGPLITTLGLTLTFPLSLAIDVYHNGKKFTLLYFVGSACIIVAFAVITIRKEQDKK
jgi:solute carrier family 35, member F5